MANLTFKVESTWTGKGFGVLMKARQHRLLTDEPETLGGSDQGPNPVELVLGGLGSCLTVLAALYAPKYGVDLRQFCVWTEEVIDPDGFLGQAPVRPGFQAIRYGFKVVSPSPSEAVDALLTHIQGLCPVKDTLAGVPVELDQTVIHSSEEKVHNAVAA